MGDYDGRSRLVRRGENILPVPEFGSRIVRTVASGNIDEFIPDAVQFGKYEITRRHTSEDKIPYRQHCDKLNVRLLHLSVLERNFSCGSLQILVYHELIKI
jgi:hypothetical protein